MRNTMFILILFVYLILSITQVRQTASHCVSTLRNEVDFASARGSFLCYQIAERYLASDGPKTPHKHISVARAVGLAKKMLMAVLSQTGARTISLGNPTVREHCHTLRGNQPHVFRENATKRTIKTLSARLLGKVRLATFRVRATYE